MTMRARSKRMEVSKAVEGSFGKKWWAWRDLNPTHSGDISRNTN